MKKGNPAADSNDSVAPPAGSERFVWENGAGITISGPDDGEIVMTWRDVFGEDYPGDAK